jgi:DNA-binding NarL/FixJ family response regulator
MNTRNKHRAAKKKRVFILGNHPVTRLGLRRLIDSESDLMTSGEAGDAQDALAMVQPPLPDLVLADLSMAGTSGLEFIRNLRAIHPEVAILVFSMHDERTYAERVLRAGAKGYIMKAEGREKLLHAIREVLGGKRFLSDGMSGDFIADFANPAWSEARTVWRILTDREFEIFQLLGQGLTTRQIAQRLNLSVPTVGTHRMNIKRKLRLETGSQLVQTAVRWAASQQLT